MGKATGWSDFQKNWHLGHPTGGLGFRLRHAGKMHYSPITISHGPVQN